MTQSVDSYLLEGCGRCPLGATPACKVHTWRTELEVLRGIILDCGLKEVSKWGVPCYTINGKNVLTLSALKDACTLGFFKGALLNDPKELLEKPGPNSQAARYLKLKTVEDIAAIETDIKAFVFEAIEVEKAGLKVAFKTNLEPIPEELEERFEADPVFKSAFEALTPGRQRGYILYFSQPKQTKTRSARIEKCVEKILKGKGLHDKYQKRKK